MSPDHFAFPKSGKAHSDPQAWRCPTCTTRRHFIGTATLGGLGLALAPIPLFSLSPTPDLSPALVPGATGERISASPGWSYRVYRSKSSSKPEVSTWVQIDLGSGQAIDGIRLYPTNQIYSPGNGFPLRFRIECSDDSAFRGGQLIADWSKSDYPNPDDNIVQFPAKGAQGRYVRLTVTRLRTQKAPSFLASAPKKAAIQQAMQALHLFALSKIDVLSKGADIAVQRPVTVDTAFGRPEDAQQLTRPARPQGEGMVTDNPQNVTAANTWRPVMNRVQAPLADVQLKDGLFISAMESNIRYLLDSYSLDDLLRQFRKRAGQLAQIPAQVSVNGWEENLPGSSAGRFLMGAGNTLHWIEDAELRRRVNAVVDGIAACREANGYIMAFPEDTFFASEHGAYTRSWTTLGLIEAGRAGNAKAFELLRGHYDLFDQRPYLPEALRGCIQGGQGMVANTQLYFTPVGKPADIQVIQRYFQEDYWLGALAAGKADAVWQYPYDRPHCYLLTHLEAYLDIYRATGDRRYLDAVLGGWELYRENWQNVGGSISIIEMINCPPKSNSLYEKLGETCGSAFWILLNQRLHLLDPEDEKYVNEIEKSIYNVILANQSGSEGIRYHTMLVGQKDQATRVNTCCEGQGTRLLGSLPQFIFSIDDDGLYVNLFEPSAIKWQHSGETMQLEIDTAFPKSPDVRLVVRPSSPVQAKIRIRTPSWAAGVMGIEVNGTHAAAGAPGSYVTLDRVWSTGDTISFVLPISLRLTQYAGIDQIEGRQRFALEYGPLLMAALGAADKELEVFGAASPMDMVAKLQPVEGRPLHFAMTSDVFGAGTGTKFIPYFEIGTEFFSCFPVIETKPSAFDL